MKFSAKNTTGVVLRFIAAAVVLGNLVFCSENQQLPKKHLNIEEPFSYARMETLLKEAGQKEYITVSQEGQTAGGRNLYLVQLTHNKTKSPWKVFFYAQQHGNEPAGKDALLHLIKYIAENPRLLPDDVELWIIPMLNPDGAEAKQRRNSLDVDLNRDHLLLSQIETKTLHKIYRQILPHVAVDCHEFTRDSRDYDVHGWQEWPLIMMDCANNPLYASELYKSGVRWCEGVVPFMQQQGHNYTRYYLGGLPPAQELRHSTPEADDARNGLGAYQGLSFIIESGVLRNEKAADSDLPQRVDAYLDLLTRFLFDKQHRAQDMAAIESARKAHIPDFIPVNYFWGSRGLTTKFVKVIDKASGNTMEIPTANFMSELIVKKSVAMPSAYIILAKDALLFKDLLDAHAIEYEIIEAPSTYKVQEARLIRIEGFSDPVYNRYAGRQIVELGAVTDTTFSAGDLFVSLAQAGGLRAALLLEPSRMYGLYSYAQFQETILENKQMPVWRILK